MLHGWRELGRPFFYEKVVDSLLEAGYQSGAEKWCNVLKCMIDVVLFLGEPG